MKTRADLLVRDALAGCFVEAARGDDSAGERIEAMHAWAQDRLAAPAASFLHTTLLTERGDPVFDAQGALAHEFLALEGYVRDRALRMHAALAWLRDARSLGNLIECARAAWDAGLFFEVHELLEPAWLREEGPEKAALQGLILAGAGLYHLTRDNLAGSSGLLRDAERHLEQSPRLGALELLEFGRRIGALGRSIACGDVRHWRDIEELPRF